MNLYRFYMKNGTQVEQEGVDLRDAMFNQGFSEDEIKNVERWEQVEYA